MFKLSERRVALSAVMLSLNVKLKEKGMKNRFIAVAFKETLL